MMQTHSKQHAPRRSAGFTLVEILIALGLFAIGMIAVASLFPVAALLQRQTAAEVIGEHAAQSAKAIVEAKTLTFNPVSMTGDLAPYYNPALSGRNKTDAVPLSAMNPTLLTQKFTLKDRGYPSASPSAADCDLYWIPFIQDISGDPDNSNWVMRIFLLEPDGRAGYPPAGAVANAANPNDEYYVPKIIPVGCKVTNQNTFTLTTGYNSTDPQYQLQSGDKIMDNNGTDYTVAEVNGTSVKIIGRILLSPSAPKTIWYAPPYGGTESPTQRIITVKIDSAVKK